MNDIRNEIKHYIDENGLTKKYVADKANIDLSKFSLILSGKRRLLAEEYFSICDALDVSYETFTQKKTA